MKHVVALSGGKDSTALALRLAEIEPRDYTYVITPTGNEPPEMIAHWRLLANLLGKPLTVVTRGQSLQGAIRKEKMLPRHNARWCTQDLKLAPYHDWLRKNAPAVSYVGLRADEETRTGALRVGSDTVETVFPMRDWGWGIEDVLGYLAKRGIEIPKRTDCMLCFWQKLGEWYELWRDNPEAYAEGERLEAEISAIRGEPATFRSPQRDTWPAGLADLRREFESGRRPERSLKMMDARREVGVCRVCTM